MKHTVTILLAGGKSKRFWPLSEKNLINFRDGNLVHYHLRTLTNLGIRNFIVVCTPAISAYLRVINKDFKGITIDKIIQDEKLPGIGQAVLLCEKLMHKLYHHYRVYIINCDDVYDPSLHKQLFLTFEREKPQVCVAAYKIKSYLPLGYFSIAGSRITGIIEKPGKDSTPSPYANMAVHLYKSYEDIYESLKKNINQKDNNDDLYERSLDYLCRTNNVIFTNYEGSWKILKYSWNVLDIMNYFLEGLENYISSKAKINKLAVISGPVIIEDDVVISEFSKISGPVIIKKGTIVGTGSMVRNSIVGENCVLGYHTEITRSYISNNCWFHTNYIGDSVLGNNISFGSGTVCANLRFDQLNIRSLVNKEKVDTQKQKLGAIIGNGVSIGVNTSLMPGVKIAKNSIIGPGIVVNRDVEENFKNSHQNQNAKSRDYFRSLLK